MEEKNDANELYGDRPHVAVLNILYAIIMSLIGDYYSMHLKP